MAWKERIFSLNNYRVQNYNHTVPVDDVEEFYAKVQQVGGANIKAVFASASAFQSGTHNFCKSKGIGHFRYCPDTVIRWELMRSPSTNNSRSLNIRTIEEALSNNEFSSEIFDFYFYSQGLFTNSLWDFFDSVSSEFSRKNLIPIRNKRSVIQDNVPLIRNVELSKISSDILDECGYEGGEVKINNIYRLCRKRYGLKIIRGLEKPHGQKYEKALGRIIFDKPEIHLFNQNDENIARDRFVVAHEISHLVLEHNKYMTREVCQEGDFAVNQNRLDIADLSRMEYQANYTASSLLMPEESFSSSFWRISQGLGTRNKGFGALYVDHQADNRRNFNSVGWQLSREYRVSFSVVIIRLKELNLINDARQINNRDIGRMISSLFK